MKKFEPFGLLITCVATMLVMGCDLRKAEKSLDLQLYNLQGKVKNITTTEYDSWSVDRKFGEYIVEDEDDISSLEKLTFDEQGNLLTSRYFYSSGELLGGVTNTYKDGKLVKSIPPEDGWYNYYSLHGLPLVVHTKHRISLPYSVYSMTIQYPEKDTIEYTLYNIDGEPEKVQHQRTIDKNTVEFFEYDNTDTLLESWVKIYTDGKVETSYFNADGELAYRIEIILLSDTQTEIYRYDKDNNLTYQALEVVNGNNQVIEIIRQDLDVLGKVTSEQLETKEYTEKGFLLSEKSTVDGELTLWSNNKYEYLEVDEQGNWTERAVFSIDEDGRDFDALERRKITYW